VTTREKTLLLGAACGYGVTELRPFVESLRTHYAGEAILLIDGRTADEALAYLASRGIGLLYFDAAGWIPLHIQTSRYIAYWDFLRSRPEYGRIFLTDVSDVIFQGDPFSWWGQGDVFFFLEDQAMTIGQCPSNRMWVHEVFGPETLAGLAAKRISCSGTILGSRGGMLAYLDQMLSFARRTTGPGFAGKRGHDQGIHNALLHLALVPGALAVENGLHVLTLGYVPNGEVIVRGDTILARNHPIPCPIVHQYNYHAVTLEWMRARYGG
jgi:hypothetical protein